MITCLKGIRIGERGGKISKGKGRSSGSSKRCSAFIELSFLAGHTEVVSHLVNKCNRSVDLDARNALGFTPLMKAALQGRTKIAKILLFAGG